MWLTVVAVALGFVCGQVAGGSPRRLAQLHPAAPGLAVLWVLLTACARYVPLGHPLGWQLAGNGAALLFCVLNSRRLGTWLLFVGVAANTAVLGLNETMPYRASAAISAGLTRLDGDFPVTALTRPARSGDRLLWLSDTIAISAGWIRDVVSIGDLVAAAGVAWVVYCGMQRERAATRTVRRRGSAPDPIETTIRTQRPRSIHVSRVRIGEAFDLLDDDESPLVAESDRDDDFDDLITTSPARLLIDLTADRFDAPERHDDTAHTDPLFLDVLRRSNPDSAEIIDEDGPIPGSIFWEARRELLARDAAKSRVNVIDLTEPLAVTEEAVS